MSLMIIEKFIETFDVSNEWEDDQTDVHTDLHQLTLTIEIDKRIEEREHEGIVKSNGNND